MHGQEVPRRWHILDHDDAIVDSICRGTVVTPVAGEVEEVDVAAPTLRAERGHQKGGNFTQISYRYR